MPDRADHGLFEALQDGRRQFLALVEGLRPDLHRYCARMTGSIVDGEDVVQDTLARAYYELGDLKELPALRSWLFRIAHNRALDFLRGRGRRATVPLEEAGQVAADLPEADSALAREEAMRLAVSRFLELAPAQRSAVILKDVLDHSLEEISSLLALSVPAVKAALHRGRTRLRALAAEAAAGPGAPPHPVPPELARYVALFNARDWDGVRSMLADEVKLDLVLRWKRAGRGEVSAYFSNYASLPGWRLQAGWLDGRPIVAVYSASETTGPDYFVDVLAADGEVTAIHDFRYVPYIAREAVFVPAPA